MTVSAITWGPAEIGVVLQGVGSLAGAAAFVYAAWTASNTFHGWRRQTLAERQIKEAERILTATYHARRALDHIRHHVLWSAERSAAAEQLGIDADDPAQSREQRDAVDRQVHLTRLEQVSAERNSLVDCLPMARALFDPKVEAALEKLHWCFRCYEAAAMELFTLPPDNATRTALRTDLNAVAKEDGENRLNILIAQKVADVEEVCLPVLRAK